MPCKSLRNATQKRAFFSICHKVREKYSTKNSIHKKFSVSFFNMKFVSIVGHDLLIYSLQFVIKKERDERETKKNIELKQMLFTGV